MIGMAVRHEWADDDRRAARNVEAADDIGGDPTPPWGLHLGDVNLVMDDRVSLAETQSKAYLAGR